MNPDETDREPDWETDATKRRQLVIWLRHSADLKKFGDGVPTFASEQLNMAADLIERLEAAGEIGTLRLIGSFTKA